MANPQIQVMVVDDDENICTITKEFLQISDDLQVDCFYSAGAAKEALSQKRYDAIVCDYQMPEEDGISFLKSLRADENDIPFILFTGKGREDIVIEALNYGADFYLQKGGPPTPQYAELTHMIRKAVERRVKSEALRESENLFRLVIETLPIGLWLADKDGKLLLGNSAGQDIWADHPRVGQEEYGVFKAWRLPSREPIRPEDWALGYAVNEGRVTEFELLEIEAFDGKHKTIYNWASPVRNAQGDIIGAFVINQDLTSETKAREELEASEQKYRSYIHNSPFGVFITDKNGCYIEVNEAACHITGYTREELLSLSIPETVHPDDIPRAKEHFDRMLREGRSSGIIGFRRKNGEKGYWSVDAVQISPTRFMGFVQDVTASKIIERDLLIKDSAMSSAMTGLALTDLDGRLTYANKRLLNMMGTAELSKVIGKRPWEMAKSKCVFEDGFNKVLDGREWSGDIELVKPDGSELVVSLSANRVLDESGKVIAVMASMNDVTERKLMEKALARSGETHRAILAHAGMGVGVWSLDGTLLFINKLASTHLNSTPEQLIGKSIAELFGDKLAKVYLQRITDAASSSAMMEHEDHVPLPNGDRWFVSIFSKVVDARDEIVGVQIISYDITERKMLENAVGTANRKLNLLINITRHDLSNQLMTLRGYLDLANSNGDGPSGANLKKAMEAGDRINTIINFTKNYEDIGINAPRWQRLGAMVQEVWNGFGLEGVEQIMEVDGTLEILADDLMVKVFHNLLDNSVKHGAPITRIRCWTEMDGEGLNLFYSDDGRGVPAEEKEKIFQKGYGTNTGMGLFLTREILELTGASIDEVGEPGKGAKFRIGLPRGTFRTGQA